MKKRMLCTVAAFALVMWTTIPAQAEFKGTLQRNMPLILMVVSGSTDATTATVYYLGRNLEVIEMVTAPGGATVQTDLPKPGRGIKRVIVEVDPPHTGLITVRLVQGAFVVLADYTCNREGDVFRWTFDVE